MLVGVNDLNPAEAFPIHLDVQQVSCYHMIEAQALHVESTGPQKHHHSCMRAFGLVSDAAVDALPAPSGKIHVTTKPGFL